MSTELVVAEKFELTDASGFAEIWRDEMGDEVPPIARIKAPSGGGTAWEVPGDDPENPDSVKELTGIVVAHHPSSKLFLDSYDDRQAGDSGRPDAWSNDGKVQVVPAETIAKCKERGLPIPSTDARNCPYGQWESASLLGKAGTGKARNEYHELYIYLGDGAVFPTQVSIPAGSLKNWKTFSGLSVVGRGLRFTQVVVGLSLKKTKNAANKEFSEVTFRVIERLDPALAAQFFEYSRGVKSLVQKDPFAAAPIQDTGDDAFEAAEVVQPQATPDPDVANPAPVGDNAPAGASKEAQLDAAYAAATAGAPEDDDIPF